MIKGLIYANINEKINRVFDPYTIAVMTAKIVLSIRKKKLLHSAKNQPSSTIYRPARIVA